MKNYFIVCLIGVLSASTALANSDLRREFFRGFSNSEKETMRPFITLHRNADSTMYLVESTVKAAKPLLSKIDGLCKGKFKALVNDEGMWNRSQPLQVAKDYCAVAAKADEYMKKGVLNALAFPLRQTAEYFDKAVKQMENSAEGKFHQVKTSFLYSPEAAFAKVAKQHSKLLALVGLDSKNVVVSSVNDARQRFIDAVVKNGSKWPYAPPKGYKKAKEKKVKKYYEEPSVYTGQKKAKVLAMHMSKSWEIVKNRLGVPVRREKHGTVLFRVADSAWCHRHVWHYSQPMVGKRPKGQTKLVANSITTRFFTACPK